MPGDRADISTRMSKQDELTEMSKSVLGVELVVPVVWVGRVGKAGVVGLCGWLGVSWSGPTQLRLMASAASSLPRRSPGKLIIICMSTGTASVYPNSGLALSSTDKW